MHHQKELALYPSPQSTVLGNVQYTVYVIDQSYTVMRTRITKER